MDVLAVEDQPQDASLLQAALERVPAPRAIEVAIRRDVANAAADREDFLLEIERAIVRTAKTGSFVAVLTVNLDRFRSVNESLGREGGDKLLCELARRLRAALRRSDTLARLGGDELGIVLQGVRDEREVEIVGERVHAAIHAPMTIDAHEVCVTASVGIALSPADGRDAGQLVASATAALRGAKDAGRNRTRFACGDVDERLQRRRLARDEIEVGLANRQFVVRYQPRFEIATGRVHGIAARPYWNHPTKGALEPRRFAASAEQEGLIGAIEQQTLDAVLDQIGGWRLSHPELPLVTMRISTCQFLADGFADRLDEMLQLRDLKANALEIAVAEAALAQQPGRAIETITELDELGVRVAIADFGSGFSPISYLTYLPINSINLTAAVVASLGDVRHAAVARSIVTLARDLGITVSAEGVARAEELTQLVELHCDVAQGELLHPAQPAEALTTLLSRSAPASTAATR
jgi:diguanylate cyclase (GGDEF)-like protein